MKLLLAWNEQFIGHFGGTEKVLANFANEMTARGHRVTVMFISEEEGDCPFYLHPTVTCINFTDLLPKRKWKSGKPLSFILKRELTRLIHKKNVPNLNADYEIALASGAIQKLWEMTSPDIVISFSARTSLLLQSTPGAKPPIVTMNHFNAEFILETTTEKDWDAMRKSTVVQVLMPHDIKVFEKALPGIHLVRIPNIVPQYDIDDSERKPVIINVARLEKKQKQQHLLIDAFAKIADRFPEWTLEFWGEEQSKTRYTKRLKSMIQDCHLENRVFLKGNTSDVESVYRRGSIFGFPSAYEGFSLAMTEAMNAGIPAVAYRSCPAVNEIIRDGETGFLVNDGAEPLAEALARLMEDENLRRKMGAAAKEDMKQFAAKTVWDQWEALMKRLVDESNQKPSLP